MCGARLALGEEYGLIRITREGVVPKNVRVYPETSVTMTNETGMIKTFDLLVGSTNQSQLWVPAGGSTSIALGAYGMTQPGIHAYTRVFTGNTTNTNVIDFSGTIQLDPWPYPDLHLTTSDRIYLAPGTHHFRTVKMDSSAKLILSGDTTIVVGGARVETGERG